MLLDPATHAVLVGILTDCPGCTRGVATLATPTLRASAERWNGIPYVRCDVVGSLEPVCAAVSVRGIGQVAKLTGS